MLLNKDRPEQSRGGDFQEEKQASVKLPESYVSFLIHGTNHSRILKYPVVTQIFYELEILNQLSS
ncbi:hypothetical protein ACQP3J_28290, partial [Escherichia coli]